MAILLGASVWTASARADETKEHCVETYEDAQKLRKGGDLVGARENLMVCASESCPDLAKLDCVKWLREVDDVMPSILVAARTASGSDVAGVRVFIDDALLTSRAGAAADVNPGDHVLRVEAAGYAPYAEKLVVSEREKARLLHVVMTPLPVTPPPTSTSTPSWPWPWIAGSVALLAASSGIALDVAGSIDLQHLRTTCAPSCAPSQLDSAKTTLVAGDALLYVGIAAAIVTTVLFFVRPHTHVAPSALAPFTLRGTF